MITGDRALAEGKHGAFFNTLEEFHKYWEQIDVITPPIFNFQFSIFNLFRPKTYNLKPITFFGNVFVHPSPWPLIFQPFWIFREGLRILKANNYKLETRNYVMTVHEFPPFYNGIGARFLWQKIRVPYMLEIHHIPGHPRAGSIKETIYKVIFGWFIKFDAAKATAVRVVNQRETPNFLIKHGVPKEKIKYVSSMYIDLDIFRPIDPPAGGEKKYDLVFVARLEKNKGIYELLRAISKVKIQMPNIKLLIIGAGPELENLKLETRNYKLETNIIFSGWLEGPEDVARAYSSARCFINPSYNEGGPRVVLEAMACGLSVITTRVGLMHDIIQDGQNGLFTDWDPVNMAEKILILLSNPEMQNKFSSAGPDLAKGYEKKSAIQNYATKLIELI